VVVPGVTASLAAAALLGAPLGHDHLTISLSDLLAAAKEECPEVVDQLPF
jgi:precorrin-3B methylase